LLLLLLQVANIGSIDESGQARPDPLRYSVKQSITPSATPGWQADIPADNAVLYV
jgi:hypothetical protein